MTYTAPTTRNPGDLITASIWNTDLVNNIAYLYGPRYTKTTSKQVVNTVTETDLLNGEITIDAGAMGTNRLLRLTALGDSFQNSGAGRDHPRFKLKLGATTILDTGASGGTPWNVNPVRFGWRIIAEIHNLGAANSQWSNLDVRFFGAITSGAGFAFATGEGATSFASNSFQAIGGNSSAIDTTINEALALTVILPVANASLDVTLKGAKVEII